MISPQLPLLQICLSWFWKYLQLIGWIFNAKDNHTTFRLYFFMVLVLVLAPSTVQLNI